MTDIFVGESSVCDFCNSKDVSWVFYCPDFVVHKSNGINSHSVGNWMACSACAGLVACGDAMELAKRSLDAYEVSKDELLSETRRVGLLDYLMTISEGFFLNFTGWDQIDEHHGV